ncbi:hypothetical protein Fcan01_24092 [Folsomia candida]|uniref:Uncharacterized protein n=1 Tax=Folsomia candida TaxID=158441 RepID=A0A226D946_FOLCA|nr:hypothetical protein Fcan01_24092 [Folsomia candida]
MVTTCITAGGNKIITKIITTKVKSKFGLHSDTKINLEDDQGAEVDEEIFSILFEQEVIPNLVFLVEGEEPPIVYVDTPPSIIGGPYSPPSVFQNREESEEESYRQVLNSHIEANLHIRELVEETNIKLFVSNDASSTLIKEFVALLIQLKGESPTARDQALFAKAIIHVVPSWRRNGSDSKFGTDILYDDVTRTGLIQARLRFIHKSINKDQVSTGSKRAVAPTGGPSPKSVPGDKRLDEDIDAPLEAIEKLNCLSSKTSAQEIKSLFLETLSHRNHLGKVGVNSILKIYTKFLDCDFLIKYEFSLMYADSVNNFVNIWPTASQKIVYQAVQINKSPALRKFMSDEFGNWNLEIAALFCLLYLIPPTEQGKGKGSRMKIVDAKDLLISFYKTGTPLQSILDTWKIEKKQPNLLCLGNNSKHLDSFFIVCDGRILPIEARNPCQATDTLFKAHYAFATECDKNLSGLCKFVQVYLYKLDVGITSLRERLSRFIPNLAASSTKMFECPDMTDELDILVVLNRNLIKPQARNVWEMRKNVGEVKLNEVFNLLESKGKLGYV